MNVSMERGWAGQGGISSRDEDSSCFRMSFMGTEEKKVKSHGKN
jgi:hypothetical protein